MLQRVSHALARLYSGLDRSPFDVPYVSHKEICSFLVYIFICRSEVGIAAFEQASKGKLEITDLASPWDGNTRFARHAIAI